MQTILSLVNLAITLSFMPKSWLLLTSETSTSVTSETNRSSSNYSRRISNLTNTTDFSNAFTKTGFQSLHISLSNHFEPHFTHTHDLNHTVVLSVSLTYSGRISCHINTTDFMNTFTQTEFQSYISVKLLWASHHIHTHTHDLNHTVILSVSLNYPDRISYLTNTTDFRNTFTQTEFQSVKLLRASHHTHTRSQSYSHTLCVIKLPRPNPISHKHDWLQ